MTACRVTCYGGCLNDRGSPKVWRWLCVHCAEEGMDRHRRETGHRDLHMVSESAPPDGVELRRRIRSANAVLPRFW